MFAQSKDLALEYERATKLTNANEALQIYQRIINTNEDSDYVWLSKLKKAEMFYATGSYITSSNIDSFGADDLTGTLIGRMSNKSQFNCLSEIELSTDSLDSFGWEPLTDNLYALELGSSAQNHTLISGLLDSNQFDYFEVDRTWSIGSSLV